MKKKTKKENKTLTLVKEILLATVDTAKEFGEITVKLAMWNKSYPVKRQKIVYDTLYRLEHQGYLKKVESKGRKKYIATLKGKTKILAYLKRNKRWDGKWRIVIFDIPEKKRKMRNFFRKKLGELGYRQLQKSVWICPYNIADTVEELIQICNAKPYIHYLLVEELDNREILTQLFKLKK